VIREKQELLLNVKNFREKRKVNFDSAEEVSDEIVMEENIDNLKSKIDKLRQSNERLT